MKQETTQSTIAEYHDSNKAPAKKYHALRMRNSLTGRYRWRVVSFGSDGEAFHRYPTAYGMRATVRLANRLNKIWDKHNTTPCVVISCNG